MAADREKARQLCGLRQGKDFRTLAAESGWNTTALFDVFLKGLSNPILERLFTLRSPHRSRLPDRSGHPDRQPAGRVEGTPGRALTDTTHHPTSHHRFLDSSCTIIARAGPSHPVPENRGAHADGASSALSRGVTAPLERGPVLLLWGIRTSRHFLPS